MDLSAGLSLIGLACDWCWSENEVTRGFLLDAIVVLPF